MKEKLLSFLMIIFFTNGFLYGSAPHQDYTTPLLQATMVTNDSIATNPDRRLNPLNHPPTPPHTFSQQPFTPSMLSLYIPEDKKHQEPKQNLSDFCRRVACCALPTMALGTLVTILIKTGALNFLN